MTYSKLGVTVTVTIGQLDEWSFLVTLRLSQTAASTKRELEIIIPTAIHFVKVFIKGCALAINNDEQIVNVVSHILSFGLNFFALSFFFGKR